MGVVLRRQLALHRAVGRVLGIVHPAVDVRPPLEPGDRGAVLSPLAARRRGDLALVAAAGPHAGGRLERGDRSVVRGDGAPLPRWRTDPRLHGHRHPGRVIARRCARRDRTGSPARTACVRSARGSSGPRVGVARRARRVVVGRRRRCQFGDALSRWSARPLDGVRRGHLAGRRRRTRLVRAGSRLAAAGVDRRALVRAVPVALAGLRRAQSRPDGVRRGDTARDPHPRVPGPRVRLVPVDRGPGPASRHVGSWPVGCRRAGGRRRRGDRCCWSRCPIPRVRSPRSIHRPSPPARQSCATLGSIHPAF